MVKSKVKKLVPVALVNQVNDVLYLEPFPVDEAALLAVEASILLFNLVFQFLSVHCATLF